MTYDPQKHPHYRPHDEQHDPVTGEWTCPGCLKRRYDDARSRRCQHLCCDCATAMAFDVARLDRQAREGATVLRWVVSAENGWTYWDLYDGEARVGWIAEWSGRIEALHSGLEIGNGHASMRDAAITLVKRVNDTKSNVNEQSERVDMDDKSTVSKIIERVWCAGPVPPHVACMREALVERSLAIQHDIGVTNDRMIDQCASSVCEFLDSRGER